MGTTWWDYVQSIVATDRQREIARRAGVGETVISKWKSGTHEPDVKSVVKFAHAYGRPVLEALIAAGAITAEDAQVAVTIPHVAGIPDAVLIAELAARLERADPDSRSPPRS